MEWCVFAYWKWGGGANSRGDIGLCQDYCLWSGVESEYQGDGLIIELAGEYSDQSFEI